MLNSSRGEAVTPNPCSRAAPAIPARVTDWGFDRPEKLCVLFTAELCFKSAAAGIVGSSALAHELVLGICPCAVQESRPVVVPEGGGRDLMILEGHDRARCGCFPQGLIISR